MSNQCPKCGEEAMDAMGKIMKRPFACRHCGRKLRLNLVYTTVLSLLYLFLVVRILFNGISAGAMLGVLAVTGAFVAACLFVPLEEKPGSGS